MKEKKTHALTHTQENFVIFRDFSPLFEIKINKLATSSPRHFLGRHFSRSFCKNGTARLGQSPFNANY
jgi:hypothetical protein